MVQLDPVRGKVTITIADETQSLVIPDVQGIYELQTRWIDTDTGEPTRSPAADSILEKRHVITTEWKEVD